MLITSLQVEDHEAKIRESFENLRRNKLRLNPNKCVFRVTSERFHGARDWSLPFFNAIKMGKEFEWNFDLDQSFQELKKYL
ncbi:hypothetical protein LIER_41285 [Lithospermum erythrorhizon]|uniref:Reverse transcriptase domain-containing protein n=1 Tax=Lithospermum erythrorhizon TaxID=34254 RepID=A0AAV3RAB9_LITER